MANNRHPSVLSFLHLRQAHTFPYRGEIGRWYQGLIPRIGKERILGRHEVAQILLHPDNVASLRQ